MMDATNETAEPRVTHSTPWTLQATEILWRDVGAEFGLLTATELSLRIGAGIADPGLVSGLFRQGRLIAMHRAGQVLFPGFQVQPGTGVVRTVICDLRQAAGSAGKSDQALITWLITRNTYLGRDRPVDLLDHPERVLASARESFGVR